jgi:hypothetical protein
VTRSLVASSWTRSTAAGVDPDGRAPRLVDDRQASRAFAGSPLSRALPRVEKLLFEATSSAQGFAALSDADGMLLWVDGSPKGLETAAGAGFVPGHLASEAALGTNAVGTAIAVGDPVQIFSAEHFSRRLHGLTCVAAPIRDPERRTIAVLDISADFPAMHPHSLSLVSAIATTIEAEIATESKHRDDRRRALYLDLVARGGYEHSALISADSGRVLASSPLGWLGPRVRLDAEGTPVLPGGVEVCERRVGGALLVRARRGSRPSGPERLRIEPVEGGGSVVTVGDLTLELSPRRSEILMRLALHPDGLDGEELRAMLCGDPLQPVTLRAEIFRLRRLLGPVIAASPYRIVAELDADPEALAAALRSDGTVRG